MPAGATWDGVYFNPLRGYLHIQTRGAQLTGRWKRPDQSAWGEMDGIITDGLARFTWNEHRVGIIGPMANSKGRGFFHYERPQGAAVDDILRGEVGTDDAEAGAGIWDAIKQRNMRPDVNAVGP